MPSTESVSHYDLIVCACGDQEYTARDAIEAAIFRGELDATWKKFLHSVAAEKQADELDLEPDESAISGAAETFRYEYDLITAEETEAWLENRGLTFDDFSDYFTRQYYASVLHGVVPDEVEYASAPSDLRELFVAELILSGELDRMTSELMRRLAARCAEKDPAPAAIAAEERKFLHRSRIESLQLADWLERLGGQFCAVTEILTIDAAYLTRCDYLLGPSS